MDHTKWQRKAEGWRTPEVAEETLKALVTSVQPIWGRANSMILGHQWVWLPQPEEG